MRVGGAYKLRAGARVSYGQPPSRRNHRAAAVRVGPEHTGQRQGHRPPDSTSGYLLGAGKSVLAIRYRAGHRLSSSSGGARRGDQVVVRVSIGQGGALVQQQAQTVAHGARLEVVGNADRGHQRDRHDARLGDSHCRAARSAYGTPDEDGLHLRVPAGFQSLSAFLDKLVEIECTLARRPVRSRKLAVPGQRGVEDEDEDEDEMEGRSPR